MPPDSSSRAPEAPPGWSGHGNRGRGAAENFFACTAQKNSFDLFFSHEEAVLIASRYLESQVLSIRSLVTQYKFNNSIQQLRQSVTNDQL